MRSFAYVRPTSVAEAVALLAEHGPAARILAGGTDLIIRLRDGTVRPSLVVDIKRIDELRPRIDVVDGLASVSAGTVMTDVAADPRMRRHFPALVLSVPRDERIQQALNEALEAFLAKFEEAKAWLAQMDPSRLVGAQDYVSPF